VDAGGTGAGAVARRLIGGRGSRTSVQGNSAKGKNVTAAAIADAADRSVRPTDVGNFDRMLAAAAGALLVATLVALFRGQAEWGLVPSWVWAHLITIIIALVLTPVMLLRRRGDRLHRQLGWVWVTAMALTALFTFNIQMINRGGFSVIHLLSVWTLIQVPRIIWHARNHRVEKHRSAVRGMVTGALLIAGFFTFPFGRMLGGWLFG
jgi:uncharacterized membrane protein